MFSEEFVRKSIGLAENSRLKYEPLLPSTQEMGSLISAFANTEGGLLILGVLCRNKKITVTGLSKDFNVDLILKNAKSKLTPLPRIETIQFEYHNKPLCAINVTKSTALVKFGGEEYGMIKNKVNLLPSTKNEMNISQFNAIELKKQEKVGSIFISYNWKNKETAERLYNILIDLGYEVTIDDHNMKYKDKISLFMASIRNSDYALIIISDEYLKSLNCMIEVLHVLKDLDATKKILPLRHKNATYFRSQDRLNYVNYWKNQVKEMEELLTGIDPTLAIDEFRKLKTIRTIGQEINEFLINLSDTLTKTVEEQEKDNYLDITNYLQNPK